MSGLSGLDSQMGRYKPVPKPCRCTGISEYLDIFRKDQVSDVNKVTQNWMDCCPHLTKTCWHCQVSTTNDHGVSLILNFGSSFYLISIPQNGPLGDWNQGPWSQDLHKLGNYLNHKVVNAAFAQAENDIFAPFTTLSKQQICQFFCGTIISNQL